MAPHTAIAFEEIVRAAGGGTAGATDRELLRRFAEAGDQAAFAALFRRHCGLVLGVCRRALSNVQDAEDACQATFLILARKAASGRWQPSLANWLHATARRVAGNARVAAERRVRRERRASTPATVQPVDRMTGRELLDVLDEELDRLPPRYREPLVLCYLEGLTRDEAAARLGVPPATVKSRLERGRKQLGDALTKRGCVVGVGLLALAATSPAGASSRRLAEGVLASAAGSPSAAVARLAAGVAVGGVGRGKLVALLALAGALALGIGWGSGQQVVSGQAPEKAAPGRLAEADGKTPNAPNVAADPEKEIAMKGRVLDPDGKPLPGARLLVAGKEDMPTEVGVSGKDGRFAVSFPRGGRPVLLAQADGFGMDFVVVNQSDGRDVEFHLVKDRPLRGRLLDTQGKPMAGVTVGLTGLLAPEDESRPGSKRRTASSAGGEMRTLAPWTGLVARTSTDDEGRFTLHGTGVGRGVGLRFRGGGIAEFHYSIQNSDDFDPEPGEAAARASKTTFERRIANLQRSHAPDQDIVGETEKPIRGVVTAADTGKGRPGAVVQLLRVYVGDRFDDFLQSPRLTTTADAAGRYEIHGAPKGSRYMLRVDGDAEAGYIAGVIEVADTAGFAPVTADFRVARGVIVKGRVLDASTGKGLPGNVVVDVLSDNPFARRYPRFDQGDLVFTTEDGSFRTVTIPGRVILVGGPDTPRLPDGRSARYRYKHRLSDPQYPQYFGAGYPDPGFLGHNGRFGFQNIWCTVLDIAPGAAVVEQDVRLEPAAVLPVLLRDPAGKPLTGVVAIGIPARPLYSHMPVTCKTDTCDVYDLEPGKPRRLLLFDPARKLAAAVTLKGDEKAPPTVTLRPDGTVKGRLIYPDGRPLAGVAVNLNYQDRQAREMLDNAARFRQAVSGADGSFAIETVIPGLAFDLTFQLQRMRLAPTPKPIPPQSVASGETKDLGSVALWPADAGAH
jgi:RNA polymerase sigma factor (sigma-70 family)